MATIESQDLSIGKLFNDFYVIPSYQREYVWEEKHVTEFIEDIYTEFSESNSTGDSEYFIGSIIVCNRHDYMKLLTDSNESQHLIYFSVLSEIIYKRLNQKSLLNY